MPFGLLIMQKIQFVKNDKSNYPNNYPNNYSNNYPNNFSNQLRKIQMLQKKTNKIFIDLFA